MLMCIGIFDHIANADIEAVKRYFEDGGDVNATDQYDGQSVWNYELLSTYDICRLYFI